MQDELQLRTLRQNGAQFYVRAFDPKTDEWVFGTDDLDATPTRVAIERTNPRRMVIHNSLLDVLSGRVTHREGVRVVLGEMPPKRGRENQLIDEGKLQIVDIEEVELAQSARKVVQNGKVIGEWTRELDQGVGRVADVALMDRGIQTMLTLSSRDVFEKRVLASARTTVRKIIGWQDGDTRFDEAQLAAYTPRTFSGALLGMQRKLTGNEREQVRYKPFEPLEAQSGEFQSVMRKFTTAERNANQAKVKLSDRPTDAVTQTVISMAMNYAVQRAMVAAVAEDCSGDNVVKESEERLVREGQLLYGHPKRSAHEFDAASREGGRLMGDEVVAGLMLMSGGDRLQGLEEHSVAFHREVMAELGTAKGFSGLTDTEKVTAYLSVAGERLNRYSHRERMAVYEAQVKAAAPERKQDLRTQTAPSEPQPRDFTKHSALANRLAKGAAEVAGEAHKFMQGIDPD